MTRASRSISFFGTVRLTFTALALAGPAPLQRACLRTASWHPAPPHREGVQPAAPSIPFPPVAGTCEELVSWDEVGGLQPARRKPLLSTQGHSFRLRSAADRRLLMAHTLDDVVIRGCSDEEHAKRSRPDGLAALRAETSFFEQEHARLREALSQRLSTLLLALQSTNGTAGVAAQWGVPPAAYPPKLPAVSASSATSAHLVTAKGAWGSRAPGAAVA